MRKLLLGALLLLSTFSFSQTIVFLENFGTGSSGTLAGSTIVDYYNGVSPNTFQNSFPIVYSGNSRIQNSSGSQGTEGNSWFPCNLPNSSGSSFMFLYIGNIFTIEGVNTNNNQLNTLSFKIRLGVTTQSRADLKLEQSIDGINYSEIVLPTLPPNQWVNLVISQNILISSNLRLKFSKVNTTGTQGSISLDDITITSPTLGVDSNSIKVCQVYPNPTNSIVYLSTNSIKNIKVYNTLGNLVIDKTITNLFDMSNLSNGIYLCEITENGNKINKKIIKI